MQPAKYLIVGLEYFQQNKVIRKDTNTHVLYIKSEVHWVTERSIHSIQHKFLITLVAEAHKKVYLLASRQLCIERPASHTMHAQMYLFIKYVKNMEKQDSRFVLKCP